MNNIVRALIIVSLCINCKACKKSGHQSSWGDMTEKSDVQYSTTPNETGDYILFVQKNESTYVERITFFVIEAKSKNKLFEKSIRPGYVKWIERYVIEFLDVPGIVAADEDLSTYSKKINISELKR